MYKLVINILFILNNVLLYFIVLKKINNGIIHFYFILMILFGFLTIKFVFEKNKLKTKIKNVIIKSTRGDYNG